MDDSPNRTPSEIARTGESANLVLFRQQLFLTARLVVAIVTGAFLLWFAAPVFLLVFAGLLCGVLLQGMAQLVSQSVHIRYGTALFAVVVLLLVASTFVVVSLAATIAEQANQLATVVQQSDDLMKERFKQYQWLVQSIEIPSAAEILKASGNWLGRITGAVSFVATGITSLIIVIFIGIYGAANPKLYRRGLLHLVPPARRTRANEVIDRATSRLRWWLIGRLANMAVVGVAIAVGLWLLGVPMALLLGLIAFLFDFVPYVGPIISAVPAVMVAFTLGIDEATYVAILYLTIQSVESYLLEPFIEQRSVEVPPVLTIVGQLLFGVLFGILGIVVASPMMALIMVLVQALYLEGTLGEPRAEDDAENATNST